MATDTAAGTEQYVSDLMHARALCNDHINQAISLFDDKHCYVRDPTPTDRRYQLHRDLQTAILNYHAEVLPYSETVEDEWEEVIDHPYSDFGEVTLAGINELPLGKKEETVYSTQPGRPAQPDTVVKEVLLPLYLANNIRNQLNRCVKKLKFIPERTPEQRVEITRELFDEVEEWAKENVEAYEG